MSLNKEELFVIESSLRNFFLKEKQKVARQNFETHLLLKYRGLSLDIQVEKPGNILFIVKIAGFEAIFRVSDGIKISGGLAGDEKLVQKWYSVYYERLKNLSPSENEKKCEMVRKSACINTTKDSIFNRIPKQSG